MNPARWSPGFAVTGTWPWPSREGCAKLSSCLGPANVVHGQQCADWRQTLGAKLKRFCATFRLPVAAPLSSPDVVADAVRVVPLCGQVMVSVPGCNAFAFGRGKLQGLRCLQSGGWLLRFLVGTFHVRISDEPTSGSAPSVTTKAPVFLLKVPAP